MRSIRSRPQNQVFGHRQARTCRLGPRLLVLDFDVPAPEARAIEASPDDGLSCAGHAKDSLKPVLAVASRLWFGLVEPEGAQPDVASLGPQKQIAGVVTGMQAVGEVLQVCDEHHLDTGVGKGVDHGLRGPGDPSRSLVEANDSLQSRSESGSRQSTILLIRASSSSSLP
jgi:hypothetical protein